LSAIIPILLALACFIIGGAHADFHRKFTKLSFGFLTASVLLGAWVVTAAFAPVVCVDVRYYPVVTEQLSNGVERDITIIEGRVINVNQELGLRVPEGGSVCRMSYKKSWLGIKFFPSSKYQVVTD